jgi:hypothetical protein
MSLEAKCESLSLEKELEKSTLDNKNKDINIEQAEIYKEQGNEEFKSCLD